MYPGGPVDRPGWLAVLGYSGGLSMIVAYVCFGLAMALYFAAIVLLVLGCDQ